jgi:hypothetical protein
MAATKAYGQFWAAGVNVPAGTTKASPVLSAVIDGRTGYGGELIYRITNSGALGAPCTITFQTSPDGTNWFDYYSVFSGDLLSGTINQGPSITMARGGMYLRAIAYGNTNNACTVEGGIQQQTGL